MRRTLQTDTTLFDESDTSDHSLRSETVNNIFKICHSKFDNSTPVPKCKSTITNLHEHCCIIIKPTLHKSCSLSDLTSEHSELRAQTIQKRQELLKMAYPSTEFDHHKLKQYLRTDTDWARHGDPYHPRDEPEVPMSICRGLKQKKQKRKSNAGSIMYASNFASDDYPERPQNTQYETIKDVPEFIESNSFEETDQASALAFPFKHTPSGNFKVFSNQVVFQSPTIGVLLADPANAKVKVKFEGTDESNFTQNKHSNCDAEFLFGPRERSTVVGRVDTNVPSSEFKIDDRNEKELRSLGYSISEPVDWTRVHLPKKVDLYQEFYRRIHNYVNADIAVHIGKEVFQCHLMVLSIYSSFFDKITERNVELPLANVSPQAFRAIYEWMIFCGSDSHKVLRRDNILDMFCAAQYLHIKDLEEQCWSFVVSEELFAEDTAFALFQEARLKKISPVMELMVPRVMRFFLPLVASSDFTKLTLDEVLVFLKSNYICVTSEMEVLMAGVRWLLGDWPARRRHVSEVMRCVRFGLVSPWQLVELKLNKDNPELLHMVQEPDVQTMVDEGLCYVIIKYWHGNNPKNYNHWIQVLGLVEPAERNWIAEEKSHASYKEFLTYLEQFQVPRDQAYQLLSMQHTPRRSDDVPTSMRGGDSDKVDMRRLKMDLPLPATLKGLADKDKGFPPAMSEFIENRRKAYETAQGHGKSWPAQESEGERGGQVQVHRVYQEPPRTDQRGRQLQEQKELQQQIIEQQKEELEMLRKQNMQLVMQQTSSHHQLSSEVVTAHEGPLTCNQAHKDGSAEVSNYKTTDSEDSMTATQEDSDVTLGGEFSCEKARSDSPAALFLATATAALASTSKVNSNCRLCTPRPQTNFGGAPSAAVEHASKPQSAEYNRANMGRLSHSLLSPSKMDYMVPGSLYSRQRETVLVMGGVDPHSKYGIGDNTGQDIRRYDPLANKWEYVGDLPEPRHNHAVAFLRGRVYLVGGADPRQDDVRGKSVVTNTVWSYEPATREWCEEPRLAVTRKNFGLVVHRMALYAIGGQDTHGRILKSVERYDPRCGRWREAASLCIGRMGVACAKHREFIWVAGGMTADQRRPLSRVVECYNSTTDQWTQISTLRFPRCFATLFSMNDKLYLIGGAARLSEKDKTTTSVGAVDVFDWKSQEWRPHAEMSIPRHGHALAYLGTQLFVIGGVTTTVMRALNGVESFCIERQSWIRGVAQLSSPLSGHAAVTLPPANLML